MIRSAAPYDVALSFASEERPYVEEVAHALREYGVNVFYDKYEQATLWGKHLGIHLDVVFRERSRFAVVFVSAAYAKKVWPRAEFESILSAKIRSRGDFLLPARFDETKIPGLLPDISYVDCNTTKPKELALLILDKIGRVTPADAGQSNRSTNPSATAPATTRWPPHWRLRPGRRSGLLAGIATALAATLTAALLLTHNFGGWATPHKPVRSNVYQSFALPPGSDHPFAITRGPSGSLWFTNGDPDGPSSNQIGQMVTVGTQAGWVNETPVQSSDSRPVGITTGVDAFWFTEYRSGKIGRMSIDGTMREYDIPNPGSGPDQITLGPDVGHDLWFTEYFGDRIGRITNAGSVTEYPLPPGSHPVDIVAGPDGALWFTESGTGQIGRITTGGALVHFPLPAGSRPAGIVDGRDGALWFAEQVGNRIGRMTPDGMVRWKTIPTPAAGPVEFAVGMDGTLWFTEQAARKVGHLLPDGHIEEVSVPSAPNDIAVGADGYIWFTEPGASQIGRIGDGFQPRPQPSGKPVLPLGEPSLDPCPHIAGAPASTDRPGSLLSSPWILDVTPPDRTGECKQGLAPGALMGKRSLRITFDLHGLLPGPGLDTAIVIDQGANSACTNAPGCTWHAISIADYLHDGPYGARTITVPLTAFPGLDPTKPVGPQMRVEVAADHAYYVEIINVVAS